jgi:rubrerythrin
MNLRYLLEKAMELEKAQAYIYKGLKEKFSFSKEISQFWSSMAEDEQGHYDRIVEMYNRLSPDGLSLAVNDELYNTVCKGLNELKPTRLECVLNLDDAYKLANEVEDYETQAVFEFVHSKFMLDSRLEVSNSILMHLDKLTSFSDRFGSANERQFIKVTLS